MVTTKENSWLFCGLGSPGPARNLSAFAFSLNPPRHHFCII